MLNFWGGSHVGSCDIQIDINLKEGRRESLVGSILDSNRCSGGWFQSANG